jgi:hypothetical protein
VSATSLRTRAVGTQVATDLVRVNCLSVRLRIPGRSTTHHTVIRIRSLAPGVPSAVPPLIPQRTSQQRRNSLTWHLVSGVKTISTKSGEADDLKCLTWKRAPIPSTSRRSKRGLGLRLVSLSKKMKLGRRAFRAHEAVLKWRASTAD